ncbi:MAG: hypothetical protein O7D91_00455, partial [Planctomycetota bacterium]|nr:hypothetical protein [Planctomycetota bacterium]
RLGPPGLEQHPKTLGNSSGSAESAAESGASNAEYVPNPAERESIDPGLASVVEAWPTLPEAIRAGIVAMVRTCDPAPEQANA